MSSQACPTCGHRATIRRVRAKAGASALPARFRNDPNYRPYVRTATDTFGTLPADWAYPEKGTRELVPAERTAIAAANAYVDAHRGQVAVIDEATNTVTGWREAA